jgi:hypothetical protein
MNSSETVTETANNADKNTAPVAARAATRNRAKQVNNTTTARVATRTTAARSAKKTTATTATTAAPVAARAARNVAPAKSSGVVAARAAAKQKAVNMGTKVSTATENTMIPQECQDSFYGCMDSFCMLDNVSGGRCRCDNRSEELDDVLDKIMKLDAQSKTLAEQGVERLQRGDAADEIEAMAEDAANKVVAGQKKTQKTLSELETDSASKKLDLSIFTNNIFDADELAGDDPFGGSDSMANKTGTSLRNAATKLCSSKLTDQCKEYSSMLQMVYVQKVKSDCVAYENDLKQQKMNSENLLKTAQKAVRDAAAEQYQNKNKYKTVGECVVPFKQCMLGEDVCGSGFSKCVVNKLVVSNTAKKGKAIKTGTTTINIDATTYDAVTSKKEYCSSVLEQCVNVRDKVWNAFLMDVAPELKAAEYAAEDEQRRGCAKNIVNCIKEAASAEGLQEGTDSWAIFTSDMKNVENICKVQLDQCGAYDSNIKDSLLKYVQLSLDAIRADRCTVSIRNCFQKEDNCGKDYSQCIGVTNFAMLAMCKDSVTVDCEGKDGEILSDYILRVAQGLLLNVDSALANACRKIIDSAMADACGSTDSCSSKIEGVSDKIIADHFIYYICPKGWRKNEKEGVGQCKTTKEELINEENTKDWEVVIEEKGEVTTNGGLTAPFGGADTNLSAALNAAYTNIANRILGYDHVRDCIAGREWQGLNGTISGTGRSASGGLKNLTASANGVIIQSLYNAVTAQLQSYKEKLENKKAEDTTSLQEGSLKKTETETEETETEEDNEELTQCEEGKCNGCISAKTKCECIAKSYFQHGPVRFGSGGKGEYTWLKDIEFKDGYCSFSYNRVKDCGDECSSSSCSYFAGCEYGDDNTTPDKPNIVRFQLKDDTPISISACKSSTDPWKNNRDYSDVLTIGNIKIAFNHCAESDSFKWKSGVGDKLDDKRLKPYRGKNACFFCSLEDLHLYPSSNSAAISQSDDSGDGGENKNLFLTFSEPQDETNKRAQQSKE